MKKVIVLFCLSVSVAFAAVPQAKTAAPGFYRFRVGDVEVTTLLDGTFRMKPGDMLQGVKPEEVKTFLAQAYEGPEVTMSINAFLINTGTKLVMVDSGAGGFMGPGLGHLVENLRAAGYRPEDVQEIYITHMHGDHIGGLIANGTKQFPNAVIRADQHDADFWLSDEAAAKATHPMQKANFAHAKEAFAAYLANGKFKPFNGEAELAPGVRAHPAYGHTPGHTVYTVESNGKKLWLLGDMIHVAAVQFPKPSATLAFDSDSKMAAKIRATDFAMAAKAGDLIAAAHLSFPGVGHIRKSAGGYTFTPLAFGWVAP